MQPTYLPWSGYFNLLWCADRFVFLDDVQFERQSWQSRNRILLNGSEHMLVVPVKRHRLETTINHAEISGHGNWRQSHWRTLVSAYAKTSFGSEVLNLLQSHYEGPEPVSLSDFNQSIIRTLCGALGIDTAIIGASDLDCPGTRSERLAKICELLDCDEYISPVGSKAYLEEDNFEGISKAKLSFQEFTPIPYSQYRSKTFVPRLSVVDVIANHGFAYASSYVAGRADAA